jgi:hypothetical protein
MEYPYPMRRRILPILTLFFLSPVVGELISGSAPPTQWLSVPTWLLVVPLYGAGAVLVRELAVRRRAGWIAVLLLGAAYGILEEGIDVMSFFNAAWPDLGAAASYGRWMDVAWVWAVHLTVYHAAFSIAIPILLVHLIYPESRAEPWLGCFGCALFGGILVASAVTGNIFFRLSFQYSPPPLPYLGSLAAIGALIFLACRVRPPAPAPGLEKTPLPHPILYGLAGFGATVVFFYTGWALPNTAFPPLLTIFLVLAIAGGIAGILAASYRRGLQFTDTRKLALISGGLMFFVLFSPFIEAQGVNKTTGEDPSGMLCVGMLTFFFLAVLTAVVWRREWRASHSRLSDSFERG